MTGTPLVYTHMELSDTNLQSEQVAERARQLIISNLMREHGVEMTEEERGILIAGRSVREITDQFTKLKSVEYSTSTEERWAIEYTDRSDNGYPVTTVVQVKRNIKDGAVHMTMYQKTEAANGQFIPYGFMQSIVEKLKAGTPAYPFLPARQRITSHSGTPRRAEGDATNPISVETFRASITDIARPMPTVILAANRSNPHKHVDIISERALAERLAGIANVIVVEAGPLIGETNKSIPVSKENSFRDHILLSFPAGSKNPGVNLSRIDLLYEAGTLGLTPELTANKPELLEPLYGKIIDIVAKQSLIGVTAEDMPDFSHLESLAAQRASRVSGKLSLGGDTAPLRARAEQAERELAAARADLAKAHEAAVRARAGQVTEAAKAAAEAQRNKELEATIATLSGKQSAPLGNEQQWMAEHIVVPNKDNPQKGTWITIANSYEDIPAWLKRSGYDTVVFSEDALKDLKTMSYNNLKTVCAHVLFLAEGEHQAGKNPAERTAALVRYSAGGDVARSTKGDDIPASMVSVYDGKTVKGWQHTRQGVDHDDRNTLRIYYTDTEGGRGDRPLPDGKICIVRIGRHL